MLDVGVSLLPVDSWIVASKPWWSKHYIRQNLQDLEVMTKYKLSNSNISSRVVPYFDLDTSCCQDMSRVSQFIEGKSRPLCRLHRHKVTSRSTVDQQFHAGVEGVFTTCANAPSNREQRRMLRFSSLDSDTSKRRILFGFIGAGGGVQLFSRTSATRSSELFSRPL